MDPGTVVYETVCDNPNGISFKLFCSLSPLFEGGYLAYFACASEEPGGSGKSWSRQVRNGRGLFRWIAHTCREWARVALSDNAISEITDAVWRIDERLGSDFLAAQVEYLIKGCLPGHEDSPPAPPTLGRLIAERSKWVDRDGGGGGYTGWAFRESLRQAAMRRFVEKHLAACGTPPVGLNSVDMSYGPPGSGREIIQRQFLSTTGSVTGRFDVTPEAVTDAQEAYDRFFRGPFGVIGGIASGEAGWCFNHPLVSQHDSFELAVRRYRYLQPRLLKQFISETQKVVHGIRHGWFAPTDIQNFVVAILRPGADPQRVESVASTAMTWHSQSSGPGYLTTFAFNPEWADYFPLD